MKNTHIWLAAALAAVVFASGCNIGRSDWQKPEPIEVKIAKEDGTRGDAVGSVISISNPILVRGESADRKEVILDAGESEFTAYSADMHRKLYAYWQPLLEKTLYYKSGIEGQAVFSVSIDADGRLVEVELLEDSGVQHYDAAAEQAIRQPCPGLQTEFEPLPAAYSGKVLTVTIAFHVNPSTEEESR